MAMHLQITEASETYRMLRATLVQVDDVLAGEMEDKTGLPFERYSILCMLAEEEDGALRPSELADALGITRSGVTRLIDRLARDGIVERRSCAADGRGNFVALTPPGEKIFRQAGRVHLRGIDQHFGSNLTVDEMADLRRIVTKLAVRTDAARTPIVSTQGTP